MTAERAGHRRFARLALLACIATVWACGSWLQHIHAADNPPLPPFLPPHHSLTDDTPITVTVTRKWKKVKLPVTIDELMSSAPLWLEMNFDDWDRLPAGVRQRGLERMRARFAHARTGPASWSSMETSDWDDVPQPIRMAVFPMIVEHWVREYSLGTLFDHPVRSMADTVTAIVMAESWFQHRASVVNEWGNRDVGLGQCSNRCRRELADMAERGLLDFMLTDDDYLNPWHASRAAVVWFGLELARARGDVGLAVRAYHRGFDGACRGEGAEYLANVQRLRRKYFGATPDRPASWEALAPWARRQIQMAGAPAAPTAARWSPDRFGAVATTYDRARTRHSRRCRHAPATVS